VPLGLRLGTPVTKQLERPGSESLFTGDALLPLIEPCSKAEVGAQKRERKMSQYTVCWIPHTQYQRSFTLRGRGVNSAVARARRYAFTGRCLGSRPHQSGPRYPTTTNANHRSADELGNDGACTARSVLAQLTEWVGRTTLSFTPRKTKIQVVCYHERRKTILWPIRLLKRPQ
jgi:hypothetical protein